MTRFLSSISMTSTTWTRITPVTSRNCRKAWRKLSPRRHGALRRAGRLGRPSEEKRQAAKESAARGYRRRRQCQPRVSGAGGASAFGRKRTNGLRNRNSWRGEGSPRSPCLTDYGGAYRRNRLLAQNGG